MLLMSVVPQEIHRETQDGPLQSTKCQLTGAGCQPLDVQGYFKGYLKYRNTQTEQDIFIIHRLGKPLLGCSAIEALAIVKLIAPVTLQSNNTVQHFQKRCKRF